MVGTLTCVAVAGDLTPRERAVAECARRGRTAFVQGCVDLLDGTAVDEDLVVALVGPPGVHVLSGREGGPDGYWPRVWAARGLLHVWEDSATAAITRAVGDPAWRVREMALEVVARHRVGDALDDASAAADDPVERVRAASVRAVTALTAAGARPVHPATDPARDPLRLPGHFPARVGRRAGIRPGHSKRDR